MKLPQHEFVKLQQYWYEKLAESGFKDIEKLTGKELVLTKSADHCYKGIDAHTRTAKEDYYIQMAKIVHDEQTVFRNFVDRFILERHVEGARIKLIMEELEAIGHCRARNTIRIIIRRYEMIWGFKFYSKEKLNIYPRKVA